METIEKAIKSPYTSKYQGRKITPEELEVQEQELLASLLKANVKPSKVYKKINEIHASTSHAHHHAATHHISTMSPAALPVEDIEQTLSHASLKYNIQSNSASTAVQSLLKKLQNQPKSDKVLITRSVLTAVQSSIADLTNREKQLIFDKDLLFKSIEDVQTRLDQTLKSHSLEKTRLEESIRDLKDALTKSKNASTFYLHGKLEEARNENRQLQLDLFKERMASKHLQKQIYAEKEEKEQIEVALLHQLKVTGEKVAANDRLKKIINSLTRTHVQQ